MMRRLATLSAFFVSLLTLIPPPAALAQEGGGTQSIFALGAGNRGLGMGGAYTAIADDASALVWNPGGLGVVGRRELQVSHTSYELGFAEEFFSFVLPSWRLGTVSVAFRQYGVDGIERRDDRNVLLDDNLSSNETELSVGFGRPIGTAWSVGGSVKLQRQDVAGLSGSGVGADVGFLVQPLVAMGSQAPTAGRLTLGVAARNLLEPSARLDRDNVPDPTMWRTGVAYRLPFFVTALDLETSRGAGSRLQAGAEIRPHANLALRGGLRDGALTAGAGIRVRDLGFDYVFEDNPLGPVHRLGVSYSFGHTVAESREAAFRAEEDRIQVRLNDAFRTREEERIQSLLSQAEHARSEGHAEDALEVVATILTLDPTNAKAVSLEATALEEQAGRLERTADYAGAAVLYSRILARSPNDPEAKLGVTRCRAESDRRAARSVEIRKDFARAMDAFAADNLPAARDLFMKVLIAAPNDEEAKAMRTRTEQAIDRRAQGLLGQARRSIAEGRWTEASDLIDQARSLSASAEGLAALTTSLRQARPPRQGASPGGADSTDGSRAAAPPHSMAATPSSPAADRQRARELWDLYRRGLQAMEQKRPDDALRYWELVWSADSTYQQVGQYLKREYLMRGLDAFAASRLDEAVAYWEKALRVDPGDSRARGYLSRAQQQITRERELLGDSR